MRAVFSQTPSENWLEVQHPTLIGGCKASFSDFTSCFFVSLPFCVFFGVSFVFHLNTRSLFTDYHTSFASNLAAFNLVCFLICSSHTSDLFQTMSTNQMVHEKLILKNCQKRHKQCVHHQKNQAECFSLQLKIHYVYVSNYCSLWITKNSKVMWYLLFRGRIFIGRKI